MISPLHIYSAQDILSRVRVRAGECKLGERVQFISDSQNWERSLQQSTASFVLLGVPEDIGVRANLGIGGAQSVWDAALTAILNIQSTTLLGGHELLVLGSLHVEDLMQRSQGADTAQLRALVADLDDLLMPIISKIVACGKVPIVIGGGHNNCFPIIAGVADALKEPIATINLDAHSDFRQIEGRHSGNGFRYAIETGSLRRYAIIGLHENYNSQTVMDDLDRHQDIHYTTFEDIMLRGLFSFEEAIQKAWNHTEAYPCGMELDLDALEAVLSSAISPSGWSVAQGRQWVYTTAKQKKPLYFHLTEAATKLETGQVNTTTGKLLAYLLSDFIKGYTASS